MRFSEYVALREQERNATIEALLLEIEALEEQLERLAIAYQKLVKGGNEHHTAGFKPIGGKDGTPNK